MTKISMAANGHEPLLWWSASQLAELETRMEAPIRAWFGQWSAIGPRALSVSCALAWEDSEGAGGAWTQLGARDDAKAWYGAGSLESLAAGWLFQCDPAARPVAAPAVLAPALAREAAHELREALREALQLEAPIAHAVPAEQLGRAWSGAVRVRIGPHDGGPTLRVLLNGAGVAVLLCPREPRLGQSSRPVLTPLREACTDQTVRLDVRLAPCELELDALRNLQLGDIVPLPHPLDNPLHVLLQGETVCQGFLGRRRDAIAIELLRGPGLATTI